MTPKQFREYFNPKKYNKVVDYNLNKFGKDTKKDIKKEMRKPKTGELNPRLGIRRSAINEGLAVDYGDTDESINYKKIIKTVTVGGNSRGLYYNQGIRPTIEPHFNKNVEKLQKRLINELFN